MTATHDSEAGFSLVSMRKMFVWLQELVVALMETAWTKKDLQCLREVPAAARAALDAVHSWAYEIVKASFADVFGQHALLTFAEAYRLIQRWEEIRKSMTEDEYSPYISSESFKAAAYRHNCIGIRFDHQGYHLCAVIELDEDADPRIPVMPGDCQYDLYRLDGEGTPNRLINSNGGFYQRVRELCEGIQNDAEFCLKPTTPT